MYKLILTELAHQDLDHIISYIAVKLSNPKAAGDFLVEVTACYGFLKGNPMMYEMRFFFGAQDYTKLIYVGIRFMHLHPQVLFHNAGKLGKQLLGQSGE